MQIEPAQHEGGDGKLASSYLGNGLNCGATRGSDKSRVCGGRVNSEARKNQQGHFSLRLAGGPIRLLRFSGRSGEIPCPPYILLVLLCLYCA
jgi:hypothetical protein